MFFIDHPYGISKKQIPFFTPHFAVASYGATIEHRFAIHDEYNLFFIGKSGLKVQINSAQGNALGKMMVENKRRTCLGKRILMMLLSRIANLFYFQCDFPIAAVC